MQYAHACTTAWANNAHRETHTDAFEPWPMSSTNVDDHLPCFDSSSISTRSFFGTPTWWSISTICITIIDLVNMISFFCRMTYFNKILPNVKVDMSCDAWWCQHRLLTTVVYSTFLVQPFLCQQNCSLNSCGHSTGNKGSSTSSTCSAGQTTSFGVTTLLWIGNSWRWDPTTSHLYASTSHSVQWHSTTGILARGSKDQNQDGPQQVASSPWRRTTSPILWCEDTREVEGIFNTGNMAEGAVNRWAPPTALRWSEQVSWANRHARQHGREQRRVINNDHNRDGAQTTSRCRSTKTTEPCATWPSTHESLKCA